MCIRDRYWNDISAAAPNTDFVIYNIPQLAGVALTMPLFHEMLKNPNVAAVKNSSMPVDVYKRQSGSCGNPEAGGDHRRRFHHRRPDPDSMVQPDHGDEPDVPRPVPG